MKYNCVVTKLVQKVLDAIMYAWQHSAMSTLHLYWSKINSHCKKKKKKIAKWKQLVKAKEKHLGF